MDYLVTVNPCFIEKLAAYGIPKEKIVYIPNFVSDKEFYPVDKLHRAKIREKFGVDQNAFVVLGVGQVQTRKGVKEFCEIAKKMPELTFVWAGGFSFGGMTEGYKELKELVENPPANVRFPGIIERSAMNDLYNMADVMFLPSYAELFPMAILESMNCEKPILLRDLDIYEDILFDYYLKGSNNSEFEEQLIRLSRDTAYYNNAVEMAKKGKRFYSEQNVVEMWDRFYSKISKEKPVRLRLKRHRAKKVVYNEK